MKEQRFDELLKDIREESATAQEVAAARRRVQDRLKGSISPLCLEFRPELGAYLEDRLTASRRLLLEDHLGRCDPCRRALAETRNGPKVVPVRVGSPDKPHWTRWALAAGIVLAVLYLGRDQIDRSLAPSGARATVASVSGEVYALPDSALQSGTELFEAETIRTGAGAHAILMLADGSRVEVNQRTRLSVQSAWSGQTVRLDYGDVMLEAAPQNSGRLRVVTHDSMVSVKGTIFAVSSATAGSLVLSGRGCRGGFAKRFPECARARTAGGIKLSSRTRQHRAGDFLEPGSREVLHSVGRVGASRERPCRAAGSGYCAQKHDWLPTYPPRRVCTLRFQI